MQLDLFIVAGEPSGDVHGKSLIQDLLNLDPHLRIGAVSGPHMRTTQAHSFFRIEDLSVMGFIDVLFHFPKLIKQFFRIRKTILTHQPKAVVLIDYPGLNLRLAKSLRNKGFQGKLIQYICPTIWAWKKSRIQTMVKNLDLVLTIFPFEPAYFSHTNLPVQYVGHPLTQKTTVLKQKRNPHLLALFPGSRVQEIQKNFPLQLQTALALQKTNPQIQIAVSIANSSVKPWIDFIAKDHSFLAYPPNQREELMESCHMAFATSGTVTLELALRLTPTLVNYFIRPLEVWMAQSLFKINLPFYCIVNILASKEIFPECFGPYFTPHPYLTQAERLWNREEVRDRCLQGCLEVQKILGTQKGTKKAAEAIKALAF